jgi:hypothetical protein
MSRTITPCAFGPCPVAPTARMGSGVPALIVQTEKDISAQLPAAQAMHRTLIGSPMIALAGGRTHGVSALCGSACVDTAVNAYLGSGNLPTADIHCPQ